MSTSGEVLEQPPDPIEIIQSFLGTNRQLMDHLGSTSSCPSVPAVAKTEELIIVAKDALGPFHDNLFFRDSEEIWRWRLIP